MDVPAHGLHGQVLGVQVGADVAAGALELGHAGRRVHLGEGVQVAAGGVQQQVGRRRPVPADVPAQALDVRHDPAVPRHADADVVGLPADVHPEALDRLGQLADGVVDAPGDVPGSPGLGRLLGLPAAGDPALGDAEDVPVHLRPEAGIGAVGQFDRDAGPFALEDLHCGVRQPGHQTAHRGGLKGQRPLRQIVVRHADARVLFFFRIGGNDFLHPLQALGHRRQDLFLRQALFRQVRPALLAVVHHLVHQGLGLFVHHGVFKQLFHHAAYGFVHTFFLPYAPVFPGSC